MPHPLAHASLPLPQGRRVYIFKKGHSAGTKDMKQLVRGVGGLGRAFGLPAWEPCLIRPCWATSWLPLALKS
jgi:hypothetical protein